MPPPLARHSAAAQAAAARRRRGWNGGPAPATERSEDGSPATRGPSGEHLIILASHSDEVLGAVLRLVMRCGNGKAADLAVARRLMIAALAALDTADSRPAREGRK